MTYTNNDINTFLAKLQNQLSNLDSSVKVLIIEQSHIDRCYPDGLILEIDGAERYVVMSLDVYGKKIGRKQVHFYFDNGEFCSNMKQVFKLE